MICCKALEMKIFTHDIYQYWHQYRSCEGFFNFYANIFIQDKTWNVLSSREKLFKSFLRLFLFARKQF